MAREEGSSTSPQDKTPEERLGRDDLMPWETPEGAVGGKDILEELDEIIAAEDGESEEGDKPKPKSQDLEESEEEEAEEEEEEEAESTDEEDADAEDAEASEEEEAEEEESEFKIPDDAMVAIVQDGEEVLVPWKEAREGVQRQADYTRKTQATAGERKALRTELEETQRVRQALGQQLDILEQALTGEGTTLEEINKLREANDPKFANEYAAYQMRQDKLAQVAAAREKLGTDQAADFARGLETRLIDEGNKLTEVIPEWKSEKVRKAALGEIQEFLMETYGASQEELNQIVDHRFILMARDARLYRTGRKKGKNALAKAKTKGMRVLKPGSQKTTPKSTKGRKGSKKAYERARDRLGRTGNVDDAARALLALPDE